MTSTDDVDVTQFNSKMWHSDDIKLMLDFCSQRLWISAKKNMPFKKLVKHIAHDFHLRIKDIWIINANVPLARENRRSLQQIGLEDYSVLTIALKVRSTCSKSKLSDGEKLKYSPGFNDLYFENAQTAISPFQRMRADGVTETITLTTEQDMVSLDDSDALRAKMPCGHVIGSDTMESYIQSQLSVNQHSIVCPFPGCNSQWSWQLISHVSLKGMHERIELQATFAQLYLLSECNAKICPKCNAYMLRKRKHDKIKCTGCTCLINGTDAKYEGLLCWNCLGECTALADCQKCQGLQDPRAGYIQQAGYISYGYFNGNVARIRACPKCGILIQYIDGCKHMTCVKCHYQFCFQCLNEWGSGILGKHQNCKTAPMQRQRDLPFHRQVLEEISLSRQNQDDAGSDNSTSPRPTNKQGLFSHLTELEDVNNFVLY